MANQQEKARQFKGLHVKGNPVILYNIWDPGSAQAVAGCGAKAIATGSHGVANAFGYEDGEQIPLEIVLENAKRVVACSGDLPVTMDIETGYGQTPDDIKRTVSKVLETGVVGVNFEDQIFGSSEVRPLEEQVERIKAVRAAADEAGVDLFINARTDIFKNAGADNHDEALLEQGLERARAFAEAGASGFFAPLLSDLQLVKKLCDESPLPVNIIWLDGMPSVRELADAGVSRISYGPGPYLKMIEWLKENARKALAME